MPHSGLLLLLLAYAYAQEGPDVLPSVPADVAPPAPDVLVEPLGARLVWELTAPLGAGVRPAGIAVQPGVGGAWFVVDERGAVWRSEDEGARWERVLRADGDDAEEAPDDEALLLEAEALLDEALEDAEVEVEVTADPTADAITRVKLEQ